MGCRAFALRGCLWPRWCSGRRRPRPPARLGDLTSFGAAPRSPPVPSGPSGALHTGGAWSLMCGASPRSPARPRRRPPATRQGPPAPSAPVGPGRCSAALRVGSKPGQAPPPLSNFARNSLATLSNIEFRSLELQRFWVLLKVHAIELRARFWEGCPCSPSSFACNSLGCVSWFEV